MGRRRPKINAAVTCWHGATGMTGPVGEVEDITALRIKLPGLDWIHRIGIDVDAKSGEVRLSVEVTDERATLSNPTLTLWPDGTFKLQN